MRTVRALLLALLPLAAALPVQATSYVPMTDAALVDQAPVIAVIEVQGSGPGLQGMRPLTTYRMRVERVLKGTLAPGQEITVTVPGGKRPDGVALRIWGAPRFAREERALLFLFPRSDGTYSISQLMLGAFHEARSGRRRLALRNLSEARPLARPGERLAQEPLRDFDRFVRWIARRARGVQAQADYLITAGSGIGQITSPFTLFVDPDDLLNMRWFEFDSSGSVEWLAHEDGQEGVTGGGFTEFQTALAAWNNDPGTTIAYTYGGTTNITNGLITDDTINTIIFNDPNNELPSFSCSSGGVLAYGGPWYTTSTIPYLGIPYHRILNADIVTNAGIACFLQIRPDAATEELFGHELGHTLGIGHSCSDFFECFDPLYNEALMRAFIHGDTRGAQLNADDRAAISSLYTPLPVSTSFFTLAPCRLLDTRLPNGTHGGPALLDGQPRSFEASGQCGIPSTATALSINLTVVASSGDGHITLFPADRIQPSTSNVNFSSGQTRSNNAVLLLSGSPQRAFTVAPAVSAGGTVQLVVDVNGYFE